MLGGSVDYGGLDKEHSISVYFDIPRDANKMKLALNESKYVALHSSPKPHLQKVLPCKHACHTWDLGLGTPCEVVSSNFHALDD